jgi:hypothetical protein
VATRTRFTFCGDRACSNSSSRKFPKNANAAAVVIDSGHPAAGASSRSWQEADAAVELLDPAFFESYNLVEMKKMFRPKPRHRRPPSREALVYGAVMAIVVLAVCVAAGASFGTSILLGLIAGLASALVLRMGRASRSRKARWASRRRNSRTHQRYD